MKLPVGILQGRLTPSRGRGIQFFPDDNWEQEFRDAETIGLSSIELLVRPTGLRQHPLMHEAGRERLKELVAETNVSIPSIHGYTAHEESYQDDLVSIVRATHEIGARVILVSFFNDKKISPIPDETWVRAHRALAPAARLGAKTGVTLGIEAELSAQTILDFIAAAETPSAFGVYYDLGNQFACGFPVADELRFLGNRIVGIHAKDRMPNTNPLTESASVPLGEGCADFKVAFEALRDIGYSRPIIIQGARKEDGGELALNAQYKKYIDGYL